MKNKKLKIKNILKTSLISTAALSTLTVIPASICASKPVASSKEATDSSLKAATYNTVTFKLSAADIEGGATIIGQTIVKVKHNGYFGTAIKPLARRHGWHFDGWAYNGQLVPDSQKVRIDCEVFAVFTQIEKTVSFPESSTGDWQWKYTGAKTVVFDEGARFADINAPTPIWTKDTPATKCWDNKWYDKPQGDSTRVEILPSTPLVNEQKFYPGWKNVDVATIIVSGKPQLSTGGDKTQYSAKVLPSTSPQEVDWYVTDDLTSPSTPSTRASIDTNGVLTSINGLTEHTVFVFALPKGASVPASLSTSDTNVITVGLIDITVDPLYSDKIIGKTGNKTYTMEVKQLYNHEGDVLATELGTTVLKSIGTKADFNMDTLTFGADVVAIDDNFLDGEIFTSFNGAIELGSVMYIGSGFLSKNANYNNTITIGGANGIRLKSIGDFFLEGCERFNPANFDILREGLIHIGANFMDSCLAFAASITIPESVREVGTAFLWDCQAFTNITIKCLVRSFEVADASFSAAVGPHQIKVTATGSCNFAYLHSEFGDLDEGLHHRQLVQNS